MDAAHVLGTWIASLRQLWHCLRMNQPCTLNPRESTQRGTFRFELSCLSIDRGHRRRASHESRHFLKSPFDGINRSIYYSHPSAPFSRCDSLFCLGCDLPQVRTSRRCGDNQKRALKRIAPSQSVESSEVPVGCYPLASRLDGQRGQPGICHQIACDFGGHTQRLEN